MSIETTAKELMEAMQPKKGPTAYDTQATVTRVDGDTLWVHIPGGVDETPIQRTIDASEGDTVQVRVSNGNAFAMGNASAPPTDDRTANAARAVADNGLHTAVNAKALAEEALEYIKIQRADIEELNADVANVNILVSTAQSTADGAQSTANGANLQEQIIFKQAVSGTSSMSGTTTWVTATGESVSSDTAGLTPVWTTKRPTYRSRYPVLFVATQRKTVSGTVTCTTPLKDDTTTVIDGGHITTGTIDASQATITNINASNITSGALTVTDSNGNVIFSADKASKSAVIGGWTAAMNELVSTDPNNYCTLILGDGKVKVRRNNVAGQYLVEANLYNQGSGYVARIIKSVGGTNVYVMQYNSSSGSAEVSHNFAGDVMVGGKLYLSGTVNGNIVPTNSGTQNIGTAASPWNYLFANSLSLSGTQTLTGVTNAYDAAHLLQFNGQYLNNTNFPGSSFLVILHGSAASNRASMFMVALDSNGQASATIAESISGAMSIGFNSAGTAYVTTSSSTGYTVYATMIKVR